MSRRFRGSLYSRVLVTAAPPPEGVRLTSWVILNCAPLRNRLNGVPLPPSPLSQFTRHQKCRMRISLLLRIMLERSML